MWQQTNKQIEEKTFKLKCSVGVEHSNKVVYLPHINNPELLYDGRGAEKAEKEKLKHFNFKLLPFLSPGK